MKNWQKIVIGALTVGVTITTIVVVANKVKNSKWFLIKKIIKKYNLKDNQNTHNDLETNSTDELKNILKTGTKDGKPYTGPSM